MTDEPSKASINRIETHDDGSIRVVSKNWIPYSRNDQNTSFTAEYPSLFTHIPQNQNQNQPLRIHIGFGTKPAHVSSMELAAINGVYAETELTERELTTAETNWCEDTFMHGGDSQPETVFEFSIPDPNTLQEAAAENELDAFDCLTAHTEDQQRRESILQDFQQTYEDDHLISVQLSRNQSLGVFDVPPEWDPDIDSVDNTKSELHDLISMRKDAQHEAFRTAIGYNYYAFLGARLRDQSIRLAGRDVWHHVPLDIVDKPEWDRCYECGAVGPTEHFLFIIPRTHDTKRFVCDSCSRIHKDRKYAEDDITAAKRKRKQRIGGQLTLEETDGL